MNNRLTPKQLGELHDAVGRDLFVYISKAQPAADSSGRQDFEKAVGVTQLRIADLLSGFSEIADPSINRCLEIAYSAVFRLKQLDWTEEAIKIWFKRPHPDLDGQSPAAYIVQREDGRGETSRRIDALL